MARRGVGIRDVAAAAGVSITTVSHVMNDFPSARVNEETRLRVRKAARELGYGPNRMAQGLRTQRSTMIGLISEEIATTPHAGRIILGAEEAARRHGFTLVILSTARTDAVEDRQRDVAALLDRQVDAIMYATMFHREVSLPANLQEVPSVLIDARDRAGIIPSVVPDEEQGARTAVSALLDAGHRRIGFANNVEDLPARHGRLRGYTAALAAAGVPFDPALVAEAPPDVPGGYQSASRLLDLPDRPTALFCFNDATAMGAYRAAAERQLGIPEDLSIVGFDNSELIAANLSPGLTTVALPHYEMGAWAVDTLVALLQGREEVRLLADGPVLMPCPLVTRDSVAPPSAV